MSSQHPMTAGARRCLDAILAHRREHDESPTIRELMERMNLQSEQSVHRYLTILDENGYIARLPRRARGIRVLKERVADPDYDLALDACRRFVDWMEGTHLKALMESERIPGETLQDAIAWARSQARTNIQTVRFYRDAFRAIAGATF